MIIEKRFTGCRKCQKTGKETYHYVERMFEFDVDRGWELAGDGREPAEVETDSVEWSVRTASIDEGHLDHVDPNIPGLMAHVWLRSIEGEIARGHVLIDGHHRAARCLRDHRPFFVVVLNEDESDSILLKSPNWQDSVFHVNPSADGESGSTDSSPNDIPSVSADSRPVRS